MPGTGGSRLFHVTKLNLDISGEYRVELPDGRTQIVTYHADHEGGFVADVK